MARNFTISKKAINLLFLLISTFVPFYSNAQDWQPIRLNEKYNYRLGEATLATNTLYADSAKVINGDPAFYLNRIVAKCDTCKAANLGGTNPPCDTCYWLSNQPQFLQREMMKKAGGVYQFNDPDTLVLKTLAAIGESWIYDAKNNISATVLNIKLKEVFGVIDSAKTITLSTKDTIEISKSFGIIKFPDGKGKSYRLSGIEGTREIGEKIPGFKEIFDFNVGDEFETYLSSIGEGGFEKATYVKTKFKILNRINDLNSIRYIIDKKFSSNYPSFFGSTKDTLIFKKNDYNYLSENILQFVPLKFPCFSYLREDEYFDEVLYYYDENNLPTKSYSYNQWKKDAYLKNKNIFLSTKITGFREYKVTFKVGLGLTHCSHEIDPYVEKFGLVAYKKGNKIVGKFTPDSLLTSAKTPKLNTSSINLYPNPANDKILIDYKEAELGQLEIISMEGIKVKQSSISTNNSEVLVNDLKEGIYILKITNSSKIFIQKLTVQK